MKFITFLLLMVCSSHVYSQSTTLPKKNEANKTHLSQLENQISDQNKVIDSLKTQILNVNESLERANKLYTYSEAVYSRTKDSITMFDRIINFFIAIIALAATLSGLSIIQSWKESKNLMVESQRKITELTNKNNEQINQATEHLIKQNTQIIEDLAKKNEELLIKEKEALHLYSIQKIAEITQSNQETIYNLVSKHNKEQFLLQNSKILIINKEETDTDNGLEMILNRFESKVDIINTLDFTNIKTEFIKQFDAVILDNVNYKDESKNWNFNVEYFNSLKLIAEETCKNKGAFLFFGRNDGGLNSKLPEYSSLINYANQAATLFANLIDLLDYRRLLLESK